MLKTSQMLFNLESFSSKCGNYKNVKKFLNLKGFDTIRDVKKNQEPKGQTDSGPPTLTARW